MLIGVACLVKRDRVGPKRKNKNTPAFGENKNSKLKLGQINGARELRGKAVTKLLVTGSSLRIFAGDVKV